MQLRTPLRVATRRSRSMLTQLLYDRRHGVETDGQVFLSELGLADDERIEYTPSGWGALRRILPASEVSSEDVFVDFGSGKGRVVLQAARYPFGRVVGVELAEPLHDVAAANIARARARSRFRCGEVRLVRSDVLAFEIPEDVTVAYFYNPFTGRIFADVLKRLLDVYDTRPARPLRIIYRNPEEEALLLATGRVRLVREVAGSGGSSPDMRLYEVVPAVSPAACRPQLRSNSRAARARTMPACPSETSVRSAGGCDSWLGRMGEPRPR